jgi:transposase
MGRIEEIAIDRKISSEDLNSLIKSESNSRVLKRLYFIKFRYLGDSVQEAASKIGITKKTGYDWQKEWNKGGYAALIPDFKGGRKHKLTEKQRKELLILLKEKDHWTTREVMELIKEKFGIEYTLKQIGIILKNFGMRYSKPYVFDYRRPKDAEDILKKVKRSNTKQS